MAYISTTLREIICIEDIITIHYFEYMSNFTFEGEAHDFWEFVCVDKGEVEVRADDASFLLKKGDVIFHKPMEFHAVKSVGQAAPNLVVMSFRSHSPEMIRFENRIFPLSKNGSMLLSRLITEARQAFSTPLHIPSIEQVQLSPTAPYGAEQFVKMYLEELLINFLRESDGCTYSKSTVPSFVIGADNMGHNPSQEAVLEKLLGYMEFHICEKLTLGNICNENLIGRTQLQELFNKVFQCGVMEYFMRMKIEHAKEIIRTSEMNFSQVSEYLMFRSPSYFAQKFRQIVGMSPSEYTNSIKGLLGGVKETRPPRSRKRSPKN